MKKITIQWYIFVFGRLILIFQTRFFWRSTTIEIIIIIICKMHIIIFRSFCIHTNVDIRMWILSKTEKGIELKWIFVIHYIIMSARALNRSVMSTIYTMLYYIVFYTKIRGVHVTCFGYLHFTQKTFQKPKTCVSSTGYYKTKRRPSLWIIIHISVLYLYMYR